MISCFLVFFASCIKDNDIPDIAIRDIINMMEETADYSVPAEKNLLLGKTAVEYGISTDSIEEGIVYYDADPKNTSEIIIITAKDKDKAISIEQTLVSVKTDFVKALENDPSQIEKSRNIILRMTGKTCILILNDNAEELEKIFENIFKKV